MKIFWFDTETTGLDHNKNSIIQISGIIEIDGKSIEEFNFKCKPFEGSIIDKEALKIQSITEEEVMKRPNPKMVYDNLIKIFDKYINKFNKTDKFIPAGHNLKFDLEFLDTFIKRNCNKYGIGSYMQWQPLDTMSIGVIMKRLNIINPPNFKLETLAKYVGGNFKFHDALDDVKASRKIGNYFLNMFGENNKEKKRWKKN